MRKRKRERERERERGDDERDIYMQVKPRRGSDV